MKKAKVIAAISVLTLLAGMSASAAGNNSQASRMSDHAFLQVCGYEIVSSGEVTAQMPKNVSYDEKTNVLTLNNFSFSDTSGNSEGIHSGDMGDDFTIRLVGNNTLNVNQADPTRGLIDSGRDNLTIEGPGSLNLKSVSCLGIQCQGDLTIDNCTINIQGNTNSVRYFYGITGSLDMETNTLIKDSKMTISSTKPSDFEGSNAGIDVQDGNLKVQNSEIDVALKNGNIFGIAAGQTWKYGGQLAIEDSKIKCNTSTDLGDTYNHNMYFYNMVNADQNYYYVQDGNSFVQKNFNETYTLDKYLYKRYDTNYGNIVISSSPLPEYCAHKWNEGKVTVAPSCEKTGEKTYTCTVCGDTKTEAIAALGHSWGEWKVIKEATCDEDGSQIRTCSRCNTTETEAISKLGHDFVVKVTKEPTCTEPGMQEKVCSRCGFAIDNEAIPATGHDYEWVVEKEATFREDGSKKGTCKNCGNVITERIPKLSESHTHDFTGKEEITKPATCTEEGIKKIYCTEPECGEYITETIPVTSHTAGDWTTVKEATCSQNGVEEKVCTVCGAVMETRSTDKLPHTYVEWTVTEEPTCTEAGVESAVCTVCGETSVKGINPLGHDFAEWTVTKEATCTEDGEETSVCTRCGQSETRAVEAKGHSFGEWKIVKEATANAEGERQAVCSVCGEVKSESIPKLSELQPEKPDTGNNTTNQTEVTTNINTTNNTTNVTNVNKTDKTNAANADTAKGVDETEKDKAPKTGDESPIVMYIIVFAAAAIVIVVAGKRRISK